MKVGFVVRTYANRFWGGDKKALNVIKNGLIQLGHSAHLVDSFSLLSDEDLIFLGNGTNCDLSFPVKFIKSFLRKKYCVIPFHEDFIKYDAPTMGLYSYIQKNLLGVKEESFDFSLERLIENPSLAYYFSVLPRKNVLSNFEALASASVCIANSNFEKATILRDCPSANVQVVYLTSGCEDYSEEEPSDDFLKLCNLKRKDYLLQVGRIQMRKNQLSTVLAAKDLDIPLVFISSASGTLTHTQFLIQAILKYRKALTIIVGQGLPYGEHKHLKIIPMPNGDILEHKMLKSAFANCGLYIHPAFYELPGYIYLEAVKFGAPIIASKWTSIEEYFSDRKTGKYLLDDRISYVNPLEIAEMTRLIHKKFGQSYKERPDLWIYKRTPVDVAREILSIC